MDDDYNFEGKTVRFPTETVQLGETVREGAEGATHRVRDDESTVVRVFWEEQRDEKVDKIRTMVNNPPRNLTYEERKMCSVLWPEAVGEDPETGEFLGYRMPFKDSKHTKSALEYAKTELKWDACTDQERYRTAYNLSIIVAAIHNEGHAIGDLNHGNILIDEDGFITLIRSDTFQITDGNAFYPHDIYLPRYVPPEGFGSDTLADVQEADRFGLGVHVFQFLMEGFHPFIAKGSEAASGPFEAMIRDNPFPYDADVTGIQPPEAAPNYNQLPMGIRQLFEQCFSPAVKKQKRERPAPKDWIKTLDDYLS